MYGFPLVGVNPFAYLSGVLPDAAAPQPVMAMMPYALAPAGMSGYVLPDAGATPSLPQQQGQAGGHVVHNPTNGMGGTTASAGTAVQPFGAQHVMYNPTNGLAGTGAAVAYLQPVVPVFLIAFPFVFAGPAVGPAPDPSPDPVVDDASGQSADEVPVPGVDAVEPSADPAPEDGEDHTVTVEGLDPATFERLRMKAVDRSLEATLSLTLTTREGDEVTLDFRQLDVLSRSFARGRLIDGGLVRQSERTESSERFVTMDVIGDLSDSEKAAVDAVLETVVDIANSFMRGSMRRALHKLSNMSFDGETLAEFSLDMSVSRSVSIDRSYKGSDAPLRVLADQDADVLKSLEFLADGQRRLIDSAKSGFDDPSAARLARRLMPPVLDGVLDLLADTVANHQAPAGTTDAAGESA